MRDHRPPRRMIALLIAVMPLTAVACVPIEPSPARVGNPGPPLPGHEQRPSCEQVHYLRGIHGRVVGSEWVDGGPYDGMRCLEIETKPGADLPEGAPGAAKSTLIRVSRRTFDRCVERDFFPQCATRKPDGGARS